MKYNIPERVLKDISAFAKKYSINKVILFGSRARGDNTERSDIDIAEILTLFIGILKKKYIPF